MRNGKADHEIPSSDFKKELSAWWQNESIADFA